MLNESKPDRNDSLGVLLRSAYGKMNPPPALEKAVRNGIPYSGKVNTRIHVRRFTKALVSYAICVALLIGGVYLASQLMGDLEPFTSSPSKPPTTASDPVTTTEPDTSEPSGTLPQFGPEEWSKYEYNGVPEVTYHPEIPSVNQPATPTVPFPTIKDPTPKPPNPWAN